MIKRYTNMNNYIMLEDKEGSFVKYDDHLNEIAKIKQAINNYLKECEDKKFDAYHNGYEFDDLELKIKILNTKKILKIIEGVE